MSTLLVDELFDGVVFEQPFRITRDINIAVIRPWVYLQGDLQDGEFQVEVLQGSTTLATASLTAAEVNAAKTETYFHGFISFCFDALTLRVAEGETETEYILKFSMQNHTTDSANFLGIVRRWESKTYDTYGTGVINNEAPNDSVEPAGLELFEYTYI